MRNATANASAVITGAAGGLGSCFARKLAQRGYRLVLVDRRQKQLDQICEAMTAQYGVVAEPCTVDLCNRDEIESLAQRLHQMENVELLVNNAGFGTTADFVDIDVSQHLDMIHVHVLTPMMLTRAVLPGMIERNRGAIINVSSLGAWSHSAGNVQYASTKTYLAVFAQSLQEELCGTNVRVQALCPGFVRTEFHEADGMKGFDLRRVPARYWMSTERVVDCSLQRLSGNQVIVFPGLRNRILGRLMQMPLFQPLVRRLAAARQRVARRMSKVVRSRVVSPVHRVAENP
jgi:short-subunit dehydrogenase